jgi:hypothetical protein
MDDRIESHSLVSLEGFQKNIENKKIKENKILQKTKTLIFKNSFVLRNLKLSKPKAFIDRRHSLR